MDYCTNKTPYELDEEYRLFIAKILNKDHEAQRDFLKLSPENRLRFERQRTSGTSWAQTSGGGWT